MIFAWLPINTNGRSGKQNKAKQSRAEHTGCVHCVDSHYPNYCIHNLIKRIVHCRSNNKQKTLNKNLRFKSSSRSGKRNHWASMRLYFSCRYKYRNFMKHIENCLALKSFLGFASSVHGERAAALGQALIQQTHCAHIRAHTHTKIVVHIYFRALHTSNIYDSTWTMFTTGSKSVHITSVPVSFMPLHKRTNEKWNNIRFTQKNIRISRLRSSVPPLLSTQNINVCINIYTFDQQQ